MKCPRCAGLMMQDDFLDLQDEAGQCRFVAWRCLICGEVLDSVILKHRGTIPAPMIDRARPQKGILSIRRLSAISRREDPANDSEAVVRSTA
jgi:hypothetical protein